VFICVDLDIHIYIHITAPLPADIATLTVYLRPCFLFCTGLKPVLSALTDTEGVRGVNTSRIQALPYAPAGRDDTTATLTIAFGGFGRKAAVRYIQREIAREGEEERDM